MTDPIQHLRELMAKASFEGPLIPQLYNFGEVADIVDHDGQMVVGDPNGHKAACGGDDAALIVAAINALPALLAVAEAARKYRDASNAVCEHCESSDGLDLKSLVKERELDEEQHVAFGGMVRALAKLDEVKP